MTVLLFLALVSWCCRPQSVTPVSDMCWICTFFLILSRPLIILKDYRSAHVFLLFFFNVVLSVCLSSCFCTSVCFPHLFSFLFTMPVILLLIISLFLLEPSLLQPLPQTPFGFYALVYLIEILLQHQILCFYVLFVPDIPALCSPSLARFCTINLTKHWTWVLHWH